MYDHRGTWNEEYAYVVIEGVNSPDYRWARMVFRIRRFWDIILSTFNGEATYGFDWPEVYVSRDIFHEVTGNLFSHNGT